MLLVACVVVVIFTVQAQPNLDCDGRCAGDECKTGIDAKDECFSQCSSMLCIASCTGPKCRAECEGYKCKAKCKGEACKATCKGVTCSVECDGIDCTKESQVW
ncbi:uncharacterized protein LOC142980704 [Anticarsia gemmatalis]|uniref:uncharacterized protein LOC142980704 n=1 Tax=Anticarsia gemmatalis TaxID=129554 RepID=UPI003F76290C